MTKALERADAEEALTRYRADNELQKQLNAVVIALRKLESEMFRLKSKGDAA